MEIQSAFNSGVQGLQKASEEVTESAREIARETAASEQSEVDNSTPSLQTAETATTGLTESLVNLKVAEVQARASTDVIKTADENLGTLLDVRV